MDRVDPEERADASPSSRRAPERPRPFVPKDRPKIRPSPNETPTRPRGIEAVRPTHRLGELPKDRPTQQSLEAVKLAEQESRIARARLGKTTPPPTALPSIASAEPATKIVARSVAPVALDARDPFAEDDPIAAMRTLYAQGDAEAALALATAITSELDEPADIVHVEPASGTFRPSAPIEPAPFSDVMVDGPSFDLGDPGLRDGEEPGGAAADLVEDDPFGGLIPVDDDEPDADINFDLGLDPFGGLVPVEPEAVPEPSEIVGGHLPIVATQTPHLLIDAREIPTLPIDPRGAFLLTLVDGIQSLEEILDTCAMPQAEALDLIEKLRLMGVIEV